MRFRIAILFLVAHSSCILIWIHIETIFPNIAHIHNEPIQIPTHTKLKHRSDVCQHSKGKNLKCYPTQMLLVNICLYISEKLNITLVTVYD